MINVRYSIAASRIPHAGQGFFLAQDVPAGSVIVAPDRIDRTLSFDEVDALPAGSLALNTSARWFEDRYTVSPAWPDDCYVNHSFEPNGLWHLAFIFAARDLLAGQELTIDYRFLLAPGVQIGFLDSLTGQPIVGHSWAYHITRSSQALAAVMQERYPQGRELT